METALPQKPLMQNPGETFKYCRSKCLEVICLKYRSRRVHWPRECAEWTGVSVAAWNLSTPLQDAWWCFPRVVQSEINIFEKAEWGFQCDDIFDGKVFRIGNRAEWPCDLLYCYASLSHKYECGDQVSIPSLWWVLGHITKISLAMII